MTTIPALLRSRSVMLPLLLSALLPISIAPSARATGFMSSGPFEVQEADRCANEFALGCVDVLGNNSISIWSNEASANTIKSWISQAVSSPFRVSFRLTFSENTAPDPGAYAFYRVGTNAAVEIGNSSNVPYTIFLDPGQTLTFGVATGTSLDAQTLTVTNFNATPVPAPLPLLGAAAAFGIIRRRRARLRAAAQAQ